MRFASFLAAWIGLAVAGSAADLSDLEKERFLREAQIVEAESVPIGVTRSQRLTLQEGEMRRDAHFQDVDQRKPVHRGRRGVETDFRDSYRYNIAAYRLDRLLDLRMTPPSVEREYDGRTGALTWWVDDVMMLELERWKKGIRPPDKDAWNDQMHQARLFNELVYNTDSNLGNVLIDKSWKIWLIDFTRAFRTGKTIENPASLGRVDRRIWENLQQLNDQALRERMGAILLQAEREALLVRRDVIVRLLEKRIAEQGEAAVICDLPGH